jgi:polyisoprenyl-phosphate glycosyltransferase
LTPASASRGRYGPLDRASSEESATVAMDEPTYSFVIPVWNEEAVVEELHRRLDAVAGSLDGSSEFILVDDGSTDRTLARLIALRERDRRLKVLSLSRNFGHQSAISAGLDFAQGEAVVIMDGDLQDPPEVVPELVARWREGYDVVYASWTSRAGETWSRRLGKRIAYRLLRRAADSELPLDASDFRLVDRRVAEVVRNMREPNPYLRGMFAWAGFRQTAVPYERPERYAGQPKYTWSGLARLGIAGILGFSTVPLRMALALGFAISALSVAGALLAVVLKLSGASNPPGWTSLVVVVTLLAGLQFIVLGMIGVYVGQISEQGKGRPRYLVAEAHGLSAEDHWVPGKDPRKPLA